MRRGVFLGIVLIALIGAACGDDGGGSTADTDAPTPADATTGGRDFVLESAAYADGGDIPAEFSCTGDDISPPLEWSGASPMATGYALIMDDLDANGFVHWVLFDIPGDTTSLEPGEDGGGTVGTNQVGTQRYLGPCPPSGNHEYVITLYALFEPLGLGPEATAADVRDAVGDAPSTELTGFFASGD